MTWRALGIPEPEPEYRFAPPRRWRFDHAWVDAKVALEVDGGVWQYGRHNRATGFLKDCEKLNEAACLGWRILRVTPQQMQTGAAMVLVARALNIIQDAPGIEVGHDPRP